MTLIPDAEALLGDYLRAHVNARVAGAIPKTFTQPWVRIVQLDASDATGSGKVEHLINYLVQLDCYAGSEGGQSEASVLAREVREQLFAMIGETINDVVVTAVGVVSHARLPDEAFEPMRERYSITAEVYAHHDA